MEVVELPPNRWATVSKHLYQYSENPQLKWLHHAEKDKALELVAKPSNGHVLVSVKVAADTVIGTYTGPITDGQTHQMVGILIIHVTER